MSVFRWKKAAFVTNAASVRPQPTFFCRVPALATGSPAASFPFLPGIESNISVCPPIRMASRMETARKMDADEESSLPMGCLVKQAPEPRKR